MATTTPQAPTRPNILGIVRSRLAPLGGLAKATLTGVYARLVLLAQLAVVVVLGLVGLRVLFRVTGANDDASFARFVYRVSGPVVEPFHPIFADRTMNDHPLEVGSLFAIGVWAAAAVILVKAVHILVSART
jgi:uncharacterized protein YggT (Ycf19 family)